MYPNPEIVQRSHHPSYFNLFLFRWPFLSREHEKLKRCESGEETGRAVGTVALLLVSDGDIEIEIESSPESFICGREDRENRENYLQGDTKSTRKGAHFGSQGETNSGDKAVKLAVSQCSPGCLERSLSGYKAKTLASHHLQLNTLTQMSLSVKHFSEISSFSFRGLDVKSLYYSLLLSQK